MRAWCAAIALCALACGDAKPAHTGAAPSPGDSDTDSDTDVAPTDADPTPTGATGLSDSGDTGANGETGTSGETGDTGDTGEATDPCSEDPALTVLSLQARGGHIDTTLELDVALSGPARVVAACASTADPGEVFFTESTEAASDHTLRLTGLLPDTDWRCAAAPSCPTMAGAAATIPWTTTAVPAPIFDLVVTVDPVLGTRGSWLLAPTTDDPRGGQVYVAIWGPEGRPRWWVAAPDVAYDVEALYVPGDDRIVWGGGASPDGRPHVVDLFAGTEWMWAPPNWQDVRFHHDGKLLADGRVITLEDRSNHHQGDDFLGFGVRIGDTDSGAVLFELDSQSLIDLGQLQPAVPPDGDPYHANWVDEVTTADGPEVLVSLCFSQQILAVDRLTGERAWLLGRGLGWTVEDATGAALTEDDLPQCAHGCEIAPDRTLLVYDNGVDRGQSSASEWHVDPDTLTVRRLWHWTEPGWFETFLGDVDYLPDGRILVTQATSQGVSEVVEVDRATGQVAARIVFANGGTTYRSELLAGCALFDAVRQCPALEARYLEVADLL